MLHFGRREFCLITGFKSGIVSFRKFREGDICFRDRVFPEKIGRYVKTIDLLSVIEDKERFTKLSDEDSIRVCLLLSLEAIFMGRELGSVVDDVLLRLVDDIEAWNAFPWGEHIWRALYDAIRNVNSKHKDEHHKALEKDPNFVPRIHCLDFSCVSRLAFLGKHLSMYFMVKKLFVIYFYIYCL